MSEHEPTDERPATTEREPLSAARLAEIRERWTAHMTGRVTSPYGSERFRQWIHHVGDAEGELLAEVDYLRTALARSEAAVAARDEIVRAVAYSITKVDWPATLEFSIEGADWGAVTLKRKARALLATTEKATPVDRADGGQE